MAPDAIASTVISIGSSTGCSIHHRILAAHFEAPVVAERIVAAIEDRAVDRRHGDYLGRVVCFFEIGDNKGTLLQFDYEHPP